MSSWVWRRQGFLALYRANWDETFAFTFSSSKLLRSSTSIQKLVLNAGANLHLPATSSRVFSSSSETLVFSGSSGMLKMMLCCFDKHTKRSSARKLDTKKKNISPQNPPNVIHNLFETEKPLIPWPWTLELWLISLLERLRQNVAGESVCLRVSFYSTYYTCKHCMIHNIFLLWIHLCL